MKRIWKVHMEVTMIRLLAVAFVLAVATSAQAMSPAPFHQPDGMTMQARVARQVPPWCDYTPGQVRVYGCPRCGPNGICMLVVKPLARHRAHRRSYEYD
jgi:hypothetical protein